MRTLLVLTLLLTLVGGAACSNNGKRTPGTNRGAVANVAANANHSSPPANAGNAGNSGNAGATRSNAASTERVGTTPSTASPPAWWRAEHVERDGRLWFGASGFADTEVEARRLAGTSARRGLAEARRVTIQAELRSDRLQELVAGEVWEASRCRDYTAAFTSESIGGARVDRNEAARTEGGYTAWAVASAPLDRVYPQRRLRELLARRGTSDDASWLAELDALATAYEAEHEAALAVLALELLAQQPHATGDDWMRLAAWHERRNEFAAAVSVLQRAAAATPPADPSRDRIAAEVARLQPRVRNWEALTGDLTLMLDRQTPTARLRLDLPEGSRPRHGQTTALTLYAAEPRAVSLFWLDDKGLYRWEWRDSTPMVQGNHAIHAVPSERGRLVLIAVACPAAVGGATALPIERAAVDSGDLDAIAGLERFNAELAEWLAVPGTRLATLRLDVE